MENFIRLGSFDKEKYKNLKKVRKNKGMCKQNPRLYYNEWVLAINRRQSNLGRWKALMQAHYRIDILNCNW